MAFLLAGAPDALFQKTVQISRIVQLYEVVCHRKVLRLLEQDGVFEGNGRRLHHRHQQVHVPTGEPIPRRAVHDLDNADDTTSRRQRRTQDRTRLKPGELVETVLKPCVVLDVVHDRGLARLRDPAGHAFTHLDARRRQVRGTFFSERHLERQVAGLFVDEKNRPRFRRNELLDLRHDHVQHAPGLENRVRGRDDVTENLKPPRSLPEARESSVALRVVSRWRCASRTSDRRTPFLGTSLRWSA